MTITRIPLWRWTPFIGRCADPSAPFARVVHIGCIEGFRAQLAEQGEKPTGAVEAALVRQAGRVR